MKKSTPGIQRNVQYYGRELDMNVYTIISSTNKVFIHFHSNNLKSEKGFRLEYHDGKFLRMLSIYSFCQKIMSQPYQMSTMEIGSL